MKPHEKAGIPGNNTDNTGLDPSKDLTDNNQNSTSEQAPNPPNPPDIFADLASFAVAPDEVVPSERVLVTLPVRRPTEMEWVRVHPDLRVRLNVVSDRPNNATYLIHGSLLEEVQELASVRPVILVLAVTTDGNAFAWPAPIPADHRPNLWHSTGFQAVERAGRNWVRVRSDTTAGQYRILSRPDSGPTPEWPAEIATVNDLCRFAFDGHGGGDVITGRDHPFLRGLRGEA